VGEILVLIGVFTEKPWVGAAVIPGVLLGAAYMLRLGQKLAWGAPSQAKAWTDLNVREWLYFAPLAVLVFYIGLAPGLTLRAIDPTLTRTLGELHTRSAAMASAPESRPMLERLSMMIAARAEADPAAGLPPASR
jgi:NADH-quinone oxidoreductase subunit M